MTTCPFTSRAYGCQCELELGHKPPCINNGDAFASGWIPGETEPVDAGNDLRTKVIKTVIALPVDDAMRAMLITGVRKADQETLKNLDKMFDTLAKAGPAIEAAHKELLKRIARAKKKSS